VTANLLVSTPAPNHAEASSIQQRCSVKTISGFCDNFRIALAEAFPIKASDDTGPNVEFVANASLRAELLASPWEQIKLELQ